MPRRRDLDPTEIPTLLSYVTLIDVRPGSSDFRYRLIGGEARDLAAEDHTGKLFSALPTSAPGSVSWEDCLETARTRTPHWRSPLPVAAKRWLRNSANILLPFSEDGSEVSLILEVVSFDVVRL
jgi:hypothetical protein